jgi:hypothetical protein
VAKPTKEDRAADRDLQYKLRRIEVVGRIINRLIEMGGLVGCAICFMLAVRALAGEKTIANIGMTGNLQISTAVAWLFGAGGIGYGWRQRGLRRNVIETRGNRVSQLETAIDARRSSSHLTDVRTKVSELRTRMHAEVGKQILLASPLCLLTGVPIVVLIAIQLTTGQLLRATARHCYGLIGKQFRRLILNPLDVAALDFSEDVGFAGITGEYPAIHV